MVAVHMFVLQVSIVRGSSMEPCLHDGDRLVVDRISYTMAEVQRGDVVVLSNPRNHSIDFVKRVVALPGDRVEMRRGKLHFWFCTFMDMTHRLRYRASGNALYFFHHESWT